MTRYKLIRLTETGTMTPVTTTNPDEVQRWLWSSLTSASTVSVTISTEYVSPPKPKAKPQCEGQRTIMDATAELSGQMAQRVAAQPVIDLMAALEDSLAEAGPLPQSVKRPCPLCVVQCPFKGPRPERCVLR